MMVADLASTKAALTVWRLVVLMAEQMVAKWAGSRDDSAVVVWDYLSAGGLVARLVSQMVDKKDCCLVECSES